MGAVASSTTPKVLLVAGTRPEAIKVAPVAVAAALGGLIEPVVCSAGQHPEVVLDVFRLFGHPIDRALSFERPNGGSPICIWAPPTRPLKTSSQRTSTRRRHCHWQHRDRRCPLVSRQSGPAMEGLRFGGSSQRKTAHRHRDRSPPRILGRTVAVGGSIRASAGRLMNQQGSRWPPLAAPTATAALGLEPQPLWPGW